MDLNKYKAFVVERSPKKEVTRRVLLSLRDKGKPVYILSCPGDDCLLEGLPLEGVEVLDKIAKGGVSQCVYGVAADLQTTVSDVLVITNNEWFKRNLERHFLEVTTVTDYLCAC